MRIWTGPLDAAIALVSSAANRAGEAATAFYSTLRQWSAIRHDDRVLRRLVFEDAVAVLDDLTRSSIVPP